MSMTEGYNSLLYHATCDGDEVAASVSLAPLIVSEPSIVMPTDTASQRCNQLLAVLL